MGQTLTWTFPEAVPGVPDQGGAEAGVETFGGDVERNVAREVIQNSLDAASEAKSGSVRVTFDVERLPSTDVPGLKELGTRLAECAAFVADQSRYKKAFEKASRLAKATHVTVLRASDYNTTGISGKDDERGGGWHSLVQSVGSSTKGGGAGGSYGIGKSAVFSASAMRTVFYSTRNEANRYIFQGVARLTTHDHRGRKSMPTGFLGDKKAASVRKKSEIPRAFQRADEPGTDVICVGYEDNGDWQREFTTSVVQNFWPAIVWGTLVVRVGDQEISRGKLAKLMQEHGGKALPYYRAYTSKESVKHSAKLPILDKVELRLLTPVDDAPNRVALVRKIGMVVDAQSVRSPLPYAGVFECRNDIGNTVLRDMEPPRHNEWDSDRPEKGKSRRTKDEFTAFFREKVREMTPAGSGDTIEMDELSPYLPDESLKGEPGIGGSADPNRRGDERFPKVPVDGEVKGREVLPKKQTRPIGDAEPDEEGDDLLTANANGGPPGPDEPNDGKPRKGDPGGNEVRQAVPLASDRTFIVGDDGTYRVVVRPQVAERLVLHLAAVGDDNRVTPERQAVTHAIEEATGDAVPVRGDGGIGPLDLPADVSTVLTVKLRQPRRLALEVRAYEAA